MADILGTLAGIGAAVNGDVQVTLESNLLPRVTVYDGTKPATGTSSGASIARALGIRGGVVVRDRNGRKLASAGEPVSFEPLRAALYVAVLLALGGVLVRLIRR